MNELEGLKAIDDVFAQLDAGARTRSFQWLRDKYDIPDHLAAPSKAQPAAAPNLSDKTIARSSKPKKAKGIYKQLKDLNFSPSGAMGAVEFIALKQPSNNNQKSVVAVYYFCQILGVDVVTVDHVYTFFKFATWLIPADLVNALQKAGTEGWLDTANAADIKLTSAGENLVEHSLPKASK